MASGILCRTSCHANNGMSLSVAPEVNHLRFANELCAKHHNSGWWFLTRLDVGHFSVSHAWFGSAKTTCTKVAADHRAGDLTPPSLRNPGRPKGWSLPLRSKSLSTDTGGKNWKMWPRWVMQWLQRSCWVSRQQLSMSIMSGKQVNTKLDGSDMKCCVWLHKVKSCRERPVHLRQETWSSAAEISLWFPGAGFVQGNFFQVPWEIVNVKGPGSHLVRHKLGAWINRLRCR